MTEIQDLGDLVAEVVERLVTGNLRPGYMAPIRRGSAAGTLAVIPDPDEDGANMLLVQLRIVRDPGTRNPAFYRRLLELNRSMNGKAAFSVDADNMVLLTAGRPMADLDPNEAIDLILWTADRADHFDDLLLGEFGAEYAL
ncbi:MAG: YbjN domain-containing protein [Gemmatimonadetes bacterium]|nr:YbjN domain-containing protein [Gemmatimonadota bacterium]